MIEQLKLYKHEVEQELHRILQYWMKFAIDEKHGGFYGRIDEYNNVDEKAPKGSVLNSRILWTFSSAYRYTKEERHLLIADRAFDYLAKHFIDPEYGGVYWTVDYFGNELDDKKQVYALAFALYGLTEYYLATQNDSAKQISIDLYRTIEQYSFDPLKGGYFEAFTRDWKEIKDLRLSAKDANEKKTMNTHLHVLEAYTNLFRIWPDSGLSRQIIRLLNNFINHIIDPGTHHLVLFFDEDWNRKSNIISFGHDIEAAWLLFEAAEIIGDPMVEKMKIVCLRIAEAASRGLDKDGGLWYEYDAESNRLIKEKHWWPQAESMVGFFNAWQLSAAEKYLHYSINSWKFIRQHIIDTKDGEWHWGINQDSSIMPNQDKAGLWKCPYHNSRACLEVLRRGRSVV